MSLILAHWTIKGAVVVADTQLSNGVGGMAGYAKKIHMIGEGPDAWIVGFTGSTVSATWMLRELRILKGSPPVGALERAFEVVLPRCGGHATGEFPRTGVETLLVSRHGILVLDGTGFIRPDVHGPFVAMGCGEEYATGWYDAVAADAPGAEGLPAVLKHCMSDAMRRYPGIGGETTVLRLEFP